MAVFDEHQNVIMGASGAGGVYVPAGAIWLDGSADYLTWTPSSGSSNTAFTFSFWTKRAGLGAYGAVLAGTTTAAQSDYIRFGTSNTFETIGDDGNDWTVVTSAVYRDTTAWEHWVVSFNNTTDVRIWNDGVEITSFSTNTESGTMGGWLRATAQYVGRNGAGQYFNGYLAEVIALDGTAVTDALNFGEYDAKGNWVPIDPTTFVTANKGTNGFWLDFANSADLGNDVSGNNNDFTLVSITSANSTSDRPADKAEDDLGNNLEIFNPLEIPGTGSWTGTRTYANGNTKFSASSGAWARMPIALNSGKWYFRFKATTLQPDGYPACGVSAPGQPDYDGGWFTGSNGWAMLTGGASTGKPRHNATSGSSLFTFSNGDYVDVAVDMDQGAGSNKIWFGRNGTWSGDPAAGTGEAYSNLPAIVIPTTNVAGSSVVETGDGTGTAPTGFKRLNTYDLPAPTVTKPDNYFNTVLYTGNGTAIGSGGKAVTGVGFQPDLVWIKNRDAADSHMIFDAISGATKYINTDDTTQDTGNNPAQATDTESLTTFGSDGFTVGSNVEVNTNTENYVAWCMKFGGSGSANASGSISSTVSVAAHGGAALIHHEGTGANGTVGHGMSLAPALMIHKNLDTLNNQIITYCDELSTPATDYLLLNRSVAKQTGGTSFWNSTVPTTSVFSVGSNASTNNSSDTILTLAFARVPGLIGIGSYTGNASADGPYVVIDDGGSGFRPAFLLTKDVNTAGDWTLWDSKRNPYNPCDNVLFVEETSSENPSGNNVDFTANGFKVRTGGADVNESGSTFIYLAFAEYPFGGSGVAPANAR